MYDIDVLLPFHIENHFFYQAIKSIQWNEYVRCRLILIDDRKSPAKLNYLPKNAELVNTYGAGYAGALNAGRELIKSSYVAMMNSDDLAHPLRFLRQVQSLQMNKVNLTACRFQKFRDTRFVLSKFGQLKERGAINRSVLLLGSYGADATWCANSEWWVQNVSFVETDMSDWITGMNVTRKTSIFYEPETLYYYRLHNQQTTHDISFAQKGLSSSYKAWTELAMESNFSLLPQNIYAWVTNPKGRTKLNPDEIETLTEWLLLFDYNTAGKFRELVERRFILIFKNHFSALLETKTNSLILKGVSNLCKAYFECSIFQDTRILRDAKL